MSDHLHIDIHIEIYDKWQMMYDGSGNILMEKLKRAINEKLDAEKIPYNGSFVSGSCY